MKKKTEKRSFKKTTEVWYLFLACSNIKLITQGVVTDTGWNELAPDPGLKVKFAFHVNQTINLKCPRGIHITCILL